MTFQEHDKFSRELSNKIHEFCSKEISDLGKQNIDFKDCHIVLMLALSTYVSSQIHYLSSTSQIPKELLVLSFCEALEDVLVKTHQNESLN